MLNVQIFSRANVVLSEIQPLAHDRLPVCHSTLPNCSSRCVLQNSLLRTLSGTKSIVRKKQKKEKEGKRKRKARRYATLVCQCAYMLIAERTVLTWTYQRQRRRIPRIVPEEAALLTRLACQ